MFDFHRASPKMAWLCLCRIKNESTETENCYLSLNRELRWLWNSVYIDLYYSVLKKNISYFTTPYFQEAVGVNQPLIFHQRQTIFSYDTKGVVNSNAS